MLFETEIVTSVDAVGVPICKLSVAGGSRWGGVTRAQAGRTRLEASVRPGDGAGWRCGSSVTLDAPAVLALARDLLLSLPAEPFGDLLGDVVGELGAVRDAVVRGEV